MTTETCPHGYYLTQKRHCRDCEILELYKEVDAKDAVILAQAKEIEKLRNYLETLRSNTPYGLYQQQITEVLQDAEEWPCTCGNCDGEHFGMAIRRGMDERANHQRPVDN